MEQEPLVSVCMPLYNGEAFLKEAFDSLERQTYSNIEVIISDDASRDTTWQLCEDYKQNSRYSVRLFKHQPQGIGANWNYCVQQAQGAYIKFLFQDDTLEPTCVASMMAAIQSDDKLGMVACKRHILVQQNSEEKRTQQWLTNFSNLQVELEEQHNYPMRLTVSDMKEPYFFSPPRNNKIGEPSAVLFRKKIIESIGLFHTQLKQALDYEYWYRILTHFDLLILNEALVSFRLHAQQATQQNLQDSSQERYRWQQILYRDYFSYLHPEMQRKLQLKFSLKARCIHAIRRAFGSTS